MAGVLGWDKDVQRYRPARRACPPVTPRLLSSHTARKRVTSAGIAGGEAAFEPFLALRRRTVIERLGHGKALHLLLQRIIADLVGRVQRLLDIALLEQVFLAGITGP